MKKPIAVLALVAAATLLASPVAAAPLPAVTIGYEESTETIANPQRGFYHHTETHYRADNSGYSPLDGAELTAFREEGITQILRVFYLEKYAGTPGDGEPIPLLEDDYLALVNADFETARAAGVSVITRFAYVQGGDWPYAPPYGDAPLDVVLAHIQQLGPLLRANADVIPVVQNGLIGLWGEGYYTDHFVTDPADPGVVTDEDWANRSAVTQALLDELPADRGVQARTMLSKQRLLGVAAAAESAVTAEQAFTNTAIARVGHHNDCFLASPDDFGTFLSDPITLDQEYLAADSLYVPIGGETCTVNPPRSEWPSASAEMARYHYSYLNRDYNQDVLNSWGEAGIEETAQRLGYRFVLTESTLADNGDGTASLSVGVRNDGWAAPYLPRFASLVLTSADGRVEVPFDDNVDARYWLPGTTTTLSATLAELPEGEYTLSLALPSADDATAADPRFAIRAANVDTWDEVTGLNALGQTITVDAAGVAVPAPGTDPAALPPTGTNGAGLGMIAGAVLATALGGAVVLARRLRSSSR